MAFDAFFKFEKGSGNALDVKGESQDEAFKDWIELASYSLSAENMLNIGSKSGGAGAGKASFGTLTLEKQPDSTSPVLFLAMCMGAHYGKATLAICRSTGAKGKKEPFLAFEFSLVAVKRISNEGSSGDDYPKETLELEYGAMSWTYRAQDKTGKLGAALTKSWSRVKNAETLDV